MTDDLIANIKLLYFIHFDKFDNFYRLILDKYRSKFDDFFRYFNKYYIKGKLFKKEIWN